MFEPHINLDAMFRILTIQFFECLNVATQSLAASYLGGGQISRARGVMVRMAALGSLVGAVVGMAVFVSQEPLTRFFTSDMAVISQASSVNERSSAAAWYVMGKTPPV